MNSLYILLLLVQARVVHVAPFSTSNQGLFFGIIGRLSQHDKSSGAAMLSKKELTTTTSRGRFHKERRRLWAISSGSTESDDQSNDDEESPKRTTYNLGVGKNLPVGLSSSSSSSSESGEPIEALQWNVPETPNGKTTLESTSDQKETFSPKRPEVASEPRRIRRMVARTDKSSELRNALWHEEHYSTQDNTPASDMASPSDVSIPTNSTSDESEVQSNSQSAVTTSSPYKTPEFFYPDIDLSIPSSIYDPETSKDVVWDLMQWEAYQEAQREPLLVSFLYSSILNHDSLESSLAFLLANKLSSAAMISTQVQSLILDALKKNPSIGRAVRADIMAVRDRDPACTCLPDVFLYFKGFHALQTYRVAHAIWKTDNKQVLAHYLQSQMSQTFQIDIHPNATLGSGIMLDHGTGIVIGETAHLGHNCSILHHVTLGGSGKKGVDRHPKVGDGVLLGAGASVLGNVKIGDGCQVGAGGLVITDLPPHSVAVGVPVKIIGSFVDVTEQPSIEMNQMMNQTYFSEGI